MKRFNSILLAGALFIGLSVKAQTGVKDTATRNFIIHASIAGMQEVACGRLASQKAVMPSVKAFGNRMIMDHTKAQQQLMGLAKAGGYQIPAQATGEVVPDAMLKEANGKKFDELYVHMMVPAHRSAVGLFQQYALNGKDPAIKTFAQQTLPVLKAHLMDIKTIDDQMTKGLIK